MTILGLSVATMFSGNAIMEVVFNRAGVGSVSVNAAKISDHPTVQAFTLIYSVMLVSANFIIDIIYGYLDPRIKIGE